MPYGEAVDQRRFHIRCGECRLLDMVHQIYRDEGASCGECGAGLYVAHTTICTIMPGRIARRTKGSNAFSAGMRKAAVRGYENFVFLAKLTVLASAILRHGDDRRLVDDTGAASVRALAWEAGRHKMVGSATEV